MKRLLFFTILLLPFFNVTAQDYVAGTVITHTSDSIRGFIKTETDIVLSEKVEIKPSATSGESQSSFPSQIKGFVLADKLYESIEVEENKHKKNYFLKCLVKGPTSLYLLRKSSSANLYYLKDSLNAFYKLEVVVERVERYIQTKEKYKGILNYCLKDCPVVSKKIAHTRYNDKALVDLIEAYNHCKAPNAVSKNYSKKLQPSFNVNVGAGAFAMNSYTNFAAKAHLEVFYPELSKNIFIKVGVNYFNSKRDYKETAIHSQFNEQLLSIPFLFNYEFGKSLLRPSAYTGFSLAIYNGQNHRYYLSNKVEEHSKVGIGLIFGLGVDYFVTKRVALIADFRYELYLHASVGLSYRFKNKR